MALMSAGAASVVVARDTSERDLVGRAQAMDAAAWDEIYETHFAAVFRYCAYRVGAQAAEDLAADVFLEAVRGIQRYQYRGTPFRAWLYRIAHNVTVDELKRGTRRGLVERSDAEPATPNNADFTAGLAARRDLEVALRSLTHDQQQVILLRFVEGLSLGETAATMKRPTGAIKALQFRAVTRLRVLMQGEVR